MEFWYNQYKSLVDGDSWAESVRGFSGIRDCVLFTRVLRIFRADNNRV